MKNKCVEGTNINGTDRAHRRNLIWAEAES